MYIVLRPDSTLLLRELEDLNEFCVERVGCIVKIGAGSDVQDYRLGHSRCRHDDLCSFDV